MNLVQRLRPSATPASVALAIFVALGVSGQGLAAFPGTNGEIVFASERSEAGGRVLWTAPPTGGPLTRIKTPLYYHGDPAWSPDGRSLAFVAYPRDTPEIFVITGDGRRLRRLTRNRLGEGSPAWSPDGAQIVFASTPGPRGDLYVMNADGTGRRRLTRTALCEGSPAWSPDGTKIAFINACARAPFPLWVMNADGKRARRIGSGNRPRWSPDGRQIAAATGFPSYPSQVVVLARDGSNQRIVTEGAQPIWSPDGRQLAFVKNESGPCDPSQVVTRVYVINLDGSGETRVTPRLSRNTCGAADEDPDWQPRCTRYGNNRNNRVTGTAGRDVLCALAGRDIIRAGGGDDVVLGGDGNDVIFGGSGKDWLFGSAGSDLILARDGTPDIVNGGPGRDQARIDRGLDRLFDAERVLR